MAIGIGGKTTSRVAAAATTRPYGDYAIVNGSDVSMLAPSYLDDLSSVGVSCVHYNRLSRDSSGLGLATDLLHFVDQNRGRVLLARSLGDIHTAKKNGQIALVMGWQSCDSISGHSDSDAWASKPTHSDLRSYYELGLRICGIAYNAANIFGGGCLDPAVPLTRVGMTLIEELHRLRILLDVGGHTGEQTSLDAIAMAPEIPVICSHTNVAALVDNPRNVSDRVIDAIAATGGVIGISAINDFNARSRRDAAIATTPKVGVERMVDHIEYVRRRVGVEHVALGPDFTQGRGASSIDPHTSSLFPPEMASMQNPISYVEGFERITEIANVTAAMRARGWSETDVRKFLGENWLRVYERAWAS